MSKNNHKDNRYFVFITNYFEENIVQDYSNEWLSKTFLEAYI